MSSSRQATRRPRASNTNARRIADERRTVTITGHPERVPAPRRLHLVPPAPASSRSGALSQASRVVHVERRRPPRRRQSRLGASPDRMAMWAVLMAFALIVVAALSSNA